MPVFTINCEYCELRETIAEVDNASLVESESSDFGLDSEELKKLIDIIF